MKKKQLQTQGTPPELVACMPYVHGDVVDGNFEAASRYEYARESAVLRKAAELQSGDPTLYTGELSSRIEAEFQCGSWFIQPEWGFIWQCRSFPAKSWNQLSEPERIELLYGLPISTTQARPLTMNELWLLDTMGIFDEFKAIAEQVRADCKENTLRSKARKKVYPVIEGWPRQKTENQPWVHALFTLNFTKTKKRLLQKFDEWLRLPENEQRFKQHQYNPVGKTGEFKDRLKDLAAWRLYEGCDRDWERANNLAQSNRLDHRPFHDPRRGQTEKAPLNEAPLYSEESGFLKAVKRAKDYLAELIPWEFGKYAEEREQQNRECAAALRKALKRTKQDF
jgi:hypothetical protein